jgi:hypothetical protein
VTRPDGTFQRRSKGTAHDDFGSRRALLPYVAHHKIQLFGLGVQQITPVNVLKVAALTESIEIEINAKIQRVPFSNDAPLRQKWRK